MKQIVLVLLLSVLSFSQGSAAQEGINVVPRPNFAERFAGTFVFSNSVPIEYAGNSDAIAIYLSGQLKLFTGISPELRPYSAAQSGPAIVIFLDSSLVLSNPESYVLTVSESGVALKARTRAGLFMGVQTLLQLIPISASGKLQASYRMPCCRILDQPRFGWRGLNLDCVRHFMSVPFIEHLIDLMSYYKFNVFHWHLTDDQGWRIQIKEYPKLTKIGAWRKEPDGSIYGGYYTQEQIREVVAYARERFITVVPEIEMPGHCTASLAAYPENSCTGGPFEVGTRWGVYNSVYDPARESTFTFLDSVLTEVMGLFPSHFIHIGGDEVVKEEWKNNAGCRELIKAKGLDGTDGLQSYFVRKIQKFVESKGRQIIGWNEILEDGGPDSGAVIESWQGIDGALQGVRKGCYAIMAPGEYTYLSRDPSNLPLDSVYSYNPMPAGLTRDEQKRILGIEASMWSEHAPQDSVIGLLFPRLLGIAEDAWTMPKEKNYENLHARLKTQYKRLEFLGVEYGLEGKAVSYKLKYDQASKRFTVLLRPEQSGIVIRFTTDGTPPTLASREYQRPIVVGGTTEIFAQAELNGRMTGVPLELGLISDKALGARIRMKEPYSPQYSGGGTKALVDGIRATTSFTDGLWQGYHGSDIEATLDLRKADSISHIGAGFLQDEEDWIFLPKSVEFLVSADGIHFHSVGTVRNDVPESDPNVTKKDFVASFSEMKARYIRMVARSVGVCPSWHPGAGHRAWTFVDEIFAN